MTDGRSTRWDVHRQLRRDEFVAAAVRAAREHGAETTADHIADEAGVTRTKLYRHFAGLADVRSAVAQSVVDEIVQELEDRWHGRDTPRDIVTSVIATFVDKLLDAAPVLAFADRVDLTATDADRSAAAATVSGRLADLFVQRLEFFGIDSGPAIPLAHAIVGMVDSVTSAALAAGDNDTDLLVERLSAWVWLLLDHTLRAGGVVLDPDLVLGDLFADLGDTR